MTGSHDPLRPDRRTRDLKRWLWIALALLGLAILGSLIACGEAPPDRASRPDSVAEPIEDEGERAQAPPVAEIEDSTLGDDSETAGDSAGVQAALRLFARRTALAPAPLLRIDTLRGVDTVLIEGQRHRQHWTAISTQDKRVTIDSTLPLPVDTARAATGIPFGPYSYASGPPVAAFSLHTSSLKPEFLREQIDFTRERGAEHWLPAFAGGRHNKSDSASGRWSLLSTINGKFQFDRRRHDSLYDAYGPRQRALVDSLAASGEIIGNLAMDEPHVYGLGDGNSWGVQYTMNKARVDSLCAKSRQTFPRVPVGPAHQPHTFEPSKSYRVCDFVIQQYSYRLGPIGEWLRLGHAMARRDGYALIGSVNIRNGGPLDRGDGAWDCRTQSEGRKGQINGQCAMTPEQFGQAGEAILRSGVCALVFWRHDDLWREAGYQQEFRRLRALADSLPRIPCSRRSA